MWEQVPEKGGLGILIFHYLNTSLLYLLIAATKHDGKANQKRGRTTLCTAAPACPSPLIQQTYQSILLAID